VTAEVDPGTEPGTVAGGAESSLNMPPAAVSARPFASRATASALTRSSTRTPANTTWPVMSVLSLVVPSKSRMTTVPDSAPTPIGTVSTRSPGCSADALIGSPICTNPHPSGDGIATSATLAAGDELASVNTCG
jgi:hypothetical protein